MNKSQDIPWICDLTVESYVIYHGIAYLGWLPGISFMKQCDFLQIHRTIKICWLNGLVVWHLTCITTWSKVASILGRNREGCHWGRSEWWCVGPGSGCSPCQLSMLLVSRSWSLQRLDEILDKVPIQPCPRHGLSLAQTPLPVSLPLSVWPVIPDRLDTSQHAIPHPSQPGLFSALLLSLCSTLRHNTGWLEDCEGLLRMTEQFQAVLSLSLLQSSCESNWNYHNTRLS